AVAGEVFVVHQAGRQLDIRRRVLIALEQRYEGVGTLFLVLREHVDQEAREAALEAPRLDDHREVPRRSGGEAQHRGREAIGWPAIALDHLALIVGLLVLVFGRNSRDLRGGEAGTSRL